MSPFHHEPRDKEFTPKYPKGKIYLGIDPGVNGGMAAIFPDDKGIETVSLAKQNPRSIWKWLQRFGRPDVRGLDYVPLAYAVIEEITPRPTRFFNKGSGKWESSILRSTCLIYASYVLLEGFLIAAGIPYQSRVPQTWQRALCLERNKSETDSSWKNSLKLSAQRKFNGTKVTLWNADALLLAWYCRMCRMGGNGN